MNPWWNQFVRAWLKIAEHYGVDNQPTTVCKGGCGQTYDTYGHNQDDGRHIIQGSHICAWSAFSNGRWVIHCGYGSDFDLTEFWYIDQFPTESVDGICDWCIRRMLRDGIIINSGLENTLEYDGYR
jgi:hypothetical protein